MLLPIRINEGVPGKFKDELKGRIMIELVALRAKAYPHFIDGYDDDYDKNKIINKKAKGTRKCITKREITFTNYKDSLFNNEVVKKSQHRFRRDHLKVYTEEINKIALSSNDNKRIQTYDKITTYPYGTNTFMVCENEMRYVILQKNILKILTHVKEKSKNKSQILRGKSQALRNETQILRSDHYMEEVNKIEIKAAEKVELIYGAMHELQDEIHSDDSWLRLL